MRLNRDALEIAPRELAPRLEAGEPVQVLDVRAPERLVTGVVSPVPPDRYLNFPGSRLLALGDPAAAGLDPEREVVVVCGHGNDSLRIAAWLTVAGYDAKSLQGGIAAWMRLTLPRSIEPPSGFDRLVQLDRPGKGALGYLLVSGAEAIAVDVSLDLETWIHEADRAGAAITAVADTHVHADYVSGGPELARALGVPWYLHPADMVYPYDGTPGTLPFSAIDEGDEIRVGGGSIRVLHTPGHTEGSVTLLAGEQAAMTGDFLFIQSVGRPDLAGKTEDWSHDLQASTSRALHEWSDSWCILPAHYASKEERNPDRTVSAELGALKETNAALQLAAKPEEFVSWVVAHEAPAPEAYRAIKAINVGLIDVSPDQLEMLEAGRNECAIA